MQKQLSMDAKAARQKVGSDVCGCMMPKFAPCRLLSGSGGGMRLLLSSPCDQSSHYSTRTSRHVLMTWCYRKYWGPTSEGFLLKKKETGSRSALSQETQETEEQVKLHHKEAIHILHVTNDPVSLANHSCKKRNRKEGVTGRGKWRLTGTWQPATMWFQIQTN